MAKRSTFALISVCMPMIGLVHAEAYLARLSIDAGTLRSGLLALERQTGIELLFDHAMVSGLQSPAVNGSLTTEAALRELLAETNLTARRAESGAWIVERPSTAPLDRPDAALPEILVVGTHTQNADIRRVENGVQPYQVATQSEIVRAHRDNLDQFFNSRITENTQTFPTGVQGEIQSSIDLRGLSPRNTLVLVDGRRMPGPLDAFGAFTQPDINAIPFHAIKRVEVLTGAAGGIYGFGALGGVVNVVLDRDSRGFDLHLTGGITSQGDAPNYRIEASFGHTSADDATDFALFGAHSEADTVLVGDRSYEVRDRRQTFDILGPETYDYLFPSGSMIRVRASTRLNPETGEVETPNLVFRPEFGGAALGSTSTFMPVGLSGNAADLTSALTQHAGQTDFSLSPDRADTDLGSNPRSDALLANFRHRFGAGLEVYADALILRGTGKSRDYAYLDASRGQAYIDASSPANPFLDSITVTYPIDDVVIGSTRVETRRYTGGLAAELPFHWRGTAEISGGEFRRAHSSSADSSPQAYSLYLFGDPSDLETNPLGNWDDFRRAVMTNSSRYTQRDNFHTQFREQSLRMAGPVASTSAGPSTLTLLAEHRTNHLPGYSQVAISESDGESTTTDTPFQPYRNDTTSLYAELKSRLFDEHVDAALLRGLELQLAIRRDDERNHFARDPRNPDSEFIDARFIGTAYTAGAKISPTSWLMLRGSYATGQQPPPLDMLVEPEPITMYGSARDPRRGNTVITSGDDDPLLRIGGNPDLKVVQANTIFLGAVFTPTGDDGPRIALDYSRIRRSRDVVLFTAEDIVLHEDAWPNRVQRESLTDEDREQGFTAGRITLVDARAMNGGTVEVEALDLRADWPLMCFGGRLRLYADATYHMNNVTEQPFETDVQRAGYLEGPLKWRANGGFDWSRGSLTLGANLQYFGSYSVDTLEKLPGTGEMNLEFQGARSIPTQSYLDLYGTWQLPFQRLGAADGLSLELGIVNVLDHVPPRESELLSNLNPGYSRYGDPRQRRIELGLTAHF